MCDMTAFGPDNPYDVMIKAIRARIEANPAGVDREMIGYRNALFDVLEELAVIRSVEGRIDG